MSENLLETKRVAQIGIIVKDIERSSEAYARFFGVPKPAWVITDEQGKAHTEYQGKPTKARAKLAFFDLDNIQLELIEPDDQPSTWREFLDTRGEGVHHIAFVITGMNDKIAVLQNNQIQMVQKGDYTGGCYSYVDTIGELKVILELLENF